MSRYPKRLVLTFDASSTLFSPREAIGKSYADTTRRHGLSGFSDDQISSSFRNAFKHETNHMPNYGKQVGMEASQWWANVWMFFLSTFIKLNKGSISRLITSSRHLCICVSCSLERQCTRRIRPTSLDAPAAMFHV